MRADSGFYNHAVVAACRKLDVRFSITIRQQPISLVRMNSLVAVDKTALAFDANNL